MKIQEIELFIKPDGEVSFEVRGVKGKKCLDITKELEIDLGGDIIAREETPEMYEQEELHEEIDQRLSERE